MNQEQDSPSDPNDYAEVFLANRKEQGKPREPKTAEDAEEAKVHSRQ